MLRRIHLGKPDDENFYPSKPTIIIHRSSVKVNIFSEKKEYSKRTFAGKIKIDEQECIVAVVVTKTMGNFYKLHRVLTLDCKEINIKRTPINKNGRGDETQCLTNCLIDALYL